MESNQRRVTFRMKRRGMHWSRLGAEAMVKIKQGIANNTLRDVYLAAHHRSHRKQRDVNIKVRIARLLRKPTRDTIGAYTCTISLYTTHTSSLVRHITYLT